MEKALSIEAFYMLHMLQKQLNLLLFDMLLVVQWINLLVKKMAKTISIHSVSKPFI